MVKHNQANLAKFNLECMAKRSLPSLGKLRSVLDNKILKTLHQVKDSISHLVLVGSDTKPLRTVNNHRELFSKLLKGILLSNSLLNLLV
jgi:hypothetical protein